MVVEGGGQTTRQGLQNSKGQILFKKRNMVGKIEKLNKHIVILYVSNEEQTTF